MSHKISLNVNGAPIQLDEFVEGYVYHVTGGIVGSLNNTGAIKSLKLTVVNNGDVKMTLNGADVPLKPFPVEIIRNTLAGMVKNLKGVNGALETLEIKISA